MANTNKSTKAKTKTAKAKTTTKAKVVSKNASKSVSKNAKVNKQSSTAKVTKPVASNKVKSAKVKTNKVSLSLLQKIYAVSIAVYVSIAGAAYFLMNDVSYQLSVGFLSKDELKSVNGTQFAPATQGVLDIQVKWIVITIALASLILPILYLTKLKNKNGEFIKSKIMTPRWIEMAVATALMVETVALLSGVFDVATLKVIGGLMVVTMVLGWMAEKRTAKIGGAAVREYYLSVVTGLLPWLIILTYAIFTIVYGDLRSPWFVYALYAVMLIGAGIIGKHQLASLKSESKLANYEVVEQKYSTLSLILRTAFLVILVVGFLAK